MWKERKKRSELNTSNLKLDIFCLCLYYCLSDSEFVNNLGQKVLVQVTAMEAIWI